MIHTFEIGQMITSEEVNSILKYYFLKDSLNIPYEVAVRKLTGRLIRDENECHTGTCLDDCNRKIPLNEYDCTTKTLTLDPSVIGLGFNKIKLMRICEIKARKKKNGIEYGVVNCIFYIRLEINPRTLSNPLDTITVDLYEATPENNSWLQLMFNSIMKSTFCKYDKSLEYLCHLESWNCSRIDYTCNLKFNTAEEKDLFWKLTHKTSLYNRTTKKRIKGIKMMDQSAAEGNNSYKTLFYDKQDECEHTYQNISQEILSRLLIEAENVIRFEHQVHKNGISTLMKKYKLLDRSIIHFLSEDISRRELLGRYNQMICKGDFYHREEAKRIIRKNIEGEKNQEKLIQLLELLAQKRHVDKARDYFIYAGLIEKIRKLLACSEKMLNHREETKRSIKKNMTCEKMMEKLVKLLESLAKIGHVNTAKNHFIDTELMKKIMKFISNYGTMNNCSKEAKRIVPKNMNGVNMKEKLIQLLELLAPQRQVDSANDNFANSNPPAQTREFPLAHGTVKTFNDRIKKLRDLGINPMLITDGCPIRSMKNPRYLLE